MSMWYRKKQRRRTSVTEHYLEHREAARVFVYERIHYWNYFYRLPFNRIAIRNQRTCWGSCSELKNLNFSYKILFLPQHLADYVIVHELCHLTELNHSPQFWALVAQTHPEYKQLRRELQKIKTI